MALIDFIENLQQKPRHVRLQIMWVGSIFGAAIIFAFWLWSLTSLLAQSSQIAKDDEKLWQSLDEIKQEAPGLLESLTAGISEVINTAKEDLGDSLSTTPTPDVDYSIERLPIEQ